MEKHILNVKAIFDHVFELATPVERAAYLDEACAGAPEIREKVEALLHAYDEAGSFLDSGAKSPTAAFANLNPGTEIKEKPGALVAGRYKLLELIGEGGMGVVYLAEQQEPVRRVVALKIIRPGMDSKTVLARFAAERQALALMDHPNIAKVLDAGATADSRPFFVMELVKGTPITTFCDANKLSARQRLELFIPVCQAIQHAHQKGVIHRDIKPSNVLIALYDDKPVPKVIDFGVAKAAGQPLTEGTLHTGFGAIVGTPEYMSPEQATFNQLDIDTRSDVYGLGVLLYELLTGSTPVDKAQFKEAAVLEVLRIVREDEPPRPSVKLSTTQARASIAATRGTEPAKLAQLMRGELDWIVMKSLEKDRNRRYDTATGLARDVERYLQDEIVEARPPSVRYRLHKFLWKHRGPVIASASILFVLLCWTSLAMLWWLQAEEATSRIERLHVENQKVTMQWMEQAHAATHERRKAVENEDLAKMSEKVAQEQKQRAEANEKQAKAAAEKALQEKQKAERATAETQRVLGFFTMTIINPALDSLHTQGDFSNISLKDALLKAEKRVATELSENPLLEAKVRQMLGGGLTSLGESVVGESQLEKALGVYKEKLGATHRETLGVMKILANTLQANGKPHRSVELMEEVIRIKKAEAAAQRVDMSDTLNLYSEQLADFYEAAGRYDDAIRLMREAVARNRLPGSNRDLDHSLYQLAVCLMLADRAKEAEPVFRESLTLYQKATKPEIDWFHFWVENELGNCLLKQKKYAEAEPLLKRSFEELKKRQGKILSSGPIAMEGGQVENAGDRLIELYDGTGRPQEATKLRQELKTPKKEKSK